jgi:hypothetical protein
MILACIKNWRSMKFSSVFLFATILIVTLLQSGCAKSSPTSTFAPPRQPEIKAAEKLGIEVIALRQTSGGFMLDFRYRVLNPEKAMPMFQEEITPYLIDQSSGSKLPTIGSTKVGPLRPTSRDPKKGVAYFMFFGNPGQLVKVGTKVTVVVADHRFENLVVQ